MGIGLKNRTRKNPLQLRLEDALALAVVVIFILFSIPRLQLPFFWDATWVYAPAIFELSHGMPSLLPDSIPLHIGRGHPLMFHFLGAIWSKIFGFSPLSLHLFALTISVTTLFMVYRFGKRFFGSYAGLIALVICATQEIFIAQSLQILPEMLLALLVLTTIYTYLHERWVLFLISGSMLLLTKETGVVTIGALGIVQVIKTLTVTTSGQRFNELFKRVLLIAIPVIVASSHYIYQKIVHGWFFFPEHMQMQIWDLIPILYRGRDVFDLIFMWQGRIAITIVALVAACGWVGRKRYWHGLVLLALLSAMYFMFYDGLGLAVPLRFLLPALCLGIAITLLLIPYMKRHPERGIAICMLVVYLGLFMAFTSINLLTSRYILNGIPIYALLCGLILSRFIVARWMLVPVIILPLFTLVYQLNQPRYVRDINLSYADGVRMYQGLVNYFSNEAEKPCVVLGTLLEMVAMGDPRAGYVDNPVDSVTIVIQRDTMKLINGEVDYLINSNVLEYLNLPKSAPDCCELAEEIKIGHAEAEIYRIKKN